MNMSRYWEVERPKTITTCRNVLSYYPAAERLAVARPMWTDDRGVKRNGRSVVLDLESVFDGGEHTVRQARAIFADVIHKFDTWLDTLGG